MTNFTVTIEPTLEMYEAPINGVQVPVRIWKGFTKGGVPIECYVLSITPDNENDVEKLRSELPEFMGRSRDRYVIDTSSDAEKRAKAIHETGWDPTN